MKHLIIIAALIAATFAAHAENERYLVVAIKASTWNDPNPTKHDKLVNFFSRFVTEGHSSTPTAPYINTASSNEILVACFAMDKLKSRNGEDIDDAKIADLKARLADNQIRIEPTNDPHALLASWGLEVPPDETP